MPYRNLDRMSDSHRRTITSEANAFLETLDAPAPPARPQGDLFG